MERLTLELDDRDAEAVRQLRASGVEIQTMILEMICGAAASHSGPVTRRPRTPEEAEAAVAAILQKHPEPKDAGPRGFDVHDRHEAADAIRGRLERKRA